MELAREQFSWNLLILCGNSNLYNANILKRIGFIKIYYAGGIMEINGTFKPLV